MVWGPFDFIKQPDLPDHLDRDQPTWDSELVEPRNCAGKICCGFDSKVDSIVIVADAPGVDREWTITAELAFDVFEPVVQLRMIPTSRQRDGAIGTADRE